MSGLIVDNFAGGGGASLGIEWALGRAPDIAINHDPVAVASHAANHPETLHLCQSVFRADPVEIVHGREVDLAWFSPDCTHHSKAKGARPRSKGLRDLAWAVVLWAERVRPRVIILENVEEFREWGPLDENGRPIKARAGETFRFWVRQIRRAGYRVEWRELRACDYGAPTIRKRLFLIARRDGLPIVWPAPTHGSEGSGLLPYRTAAECIEWSIPCPSIFLSREEARDYAAQHGRRLVRPLSEATMRRLAKGVRKFVLDDPNPFLVPRAWLDETWHRRHERVAAFLAQHNTGVVGRRADLSMSTIMTTGSHQALVMARLRRGGARAGERVLAFLTKYYGTAVGQDPREPLHTVTTNHRFGMVAIRAEDCALVDIGMRMLEPRELYRAQGFPDSYVIDAEVDGRPLSRAEQIACCGNAVPPPVAEALVRANLVGLGSQSSGAPAAAQPLAAKVDGGRG